MTFAHTPIASSRPETQNAMNNRLLGPWLSHTSLLPSRPETETDVNKHCWNLFRTQPKKKTVCTSPNYCRNSRAMFLFGKNPLYQHDKTHPIAPFLRWGNRFPQRCRNSPSTFPSSVEFCFNHTMKIWDKAHAGRWRNWSSGYGAVKVHTADSANFTEDDNSTTAVARTLMWKQEVPFAWQPPLVQHEKKAFFCRPSPSCHQKHGRWFIQKSLFNVSSSVISRDWCHIFNKSDVHFRPGGCSKCALDASTKKVRGHFARPWNAASVFPSIKVPSAQQTMQLDPNAKELSTRLNPTAIL